MDESIKCLRCHTQMGAGYLTDATYGGTLQQTWAEGTPKKSFWMGLKITRTELVPVSTLRRPQCGYLESYARRRPSEE